MPAIITEKGATIVANRLKGVGNEPVYIGWGTGAAIALPEDLTLSSEDSTPGYARQAGTSSVVTGTLANDTFQVVATLTALVALNITNWGLFDAVSGGNLLAKESRATAIELAIGGTLTITMRVKMEPKNS